MEARSKEPLERRTQEALDSERTNPATRKDGSFSRRQRSVNNGGGSKEGHHE
jgi:hypothetical protein